MGSPVRQQWAGWSPGQVKFTGQIGPRGSSFLAESIRGPQRQDFVDGVEKFIASASARSPPMEGYAGRNRETESAFPAKKREDARPPSRFSSEIGTKADAKQ